MSGAPLRLFMGCVITSLPRGVRSCVGGGWHESEEAAKRSFHADVCRDFPGEPIVSTAVYDMTYLSLEPRP